MGKKEKGNSSKKMIEFEKRFIKFVDDNITLDSFGKTICRELENELKKCQNNKGARVKVEIDDFMNFPNIKIVKVIDFLDNPTLKKNFELYLEGEVNILYLEKEKRFLPVPAKRGKFIDFSWDSTKGDKISESNQGNIIPILKTNHSFLLNEDLLELVFDISIPSVVILEEKYFLICLSPKLSIASLKDYRSELSQAFNKHFANKKGRRKSKETKLAHSIFNDIFTELNESKGSLSRESKCRIVKKRMENKYGIKLSWETLKKDYYPEWEKHNKKPSVSISDLSKDFEKLYERLPELEDLAMEEIERLSLELSEKVKKHKEKRQGGVKV
ncbi:MAG: hypothetical protein JRJ00_01290 [Deltaproteobacteria bacterium]|nr:hypothetical protein [Deltaproteobacteria bacterium]